MENKYEFIFNLKNKNNKNRVDKLALESRYGLEMISMIIQDYNNRECNQEQALKNIGEIISIYFNKY